MHEYITAQEAAEIWGITVRRVQVLCSQGRVCGAVKHASVWVIPRNSTKPIPEKSGRKTLKSEKKSSNE